MKSTIFKLSMVAVATLAAFAGNANATSLIAINSSNQVSIFDSSNAAGAIFNTISGNGFGENFIGIDLRPSNSLVYGITRSNKIYTIDAATGNSGFVASLGNSVITSNSSYGIDFNPIADRGTGASLRLTSSTGDNYAINANTGAVTVATSLTGAYTAVSYTNSDPSTPSVAPASTSLYYINSANDTLNVATSSFNNPTITTVGPLNHVILSANGFDIDVNGVGYAAVNMDDGSLRSRLLTINTATGGATFLGTFNGTINGLTVAPVPEPEPETYAMLLAGLGLVGFMSRRKNKPA